MLAPETLLHDRYQILRPIGRGGMGAVYLATDKRFASPVAVKETLADLHDSDARTAFEREAALLNRLRHPALAHVIDYFAEGDRQYLVMQYAEGQNLHDALEQRLRDGDGPFPIDQVLDWAEELLDVLDYLHRQEPSVLHLDIKPGNLILGENGRLLLVDFGLARVKCRTDDGYQSLAAYTPPYASWEQLSDEGLDPRSDLFSLGATLYHLTAGRLPANAASRMRSFGATPIRGPELLIPVKDLVPEVFPMVSEVIDRSLALIKDDRYPSAAAMLEHLRLARQSTRLAPYPIPQFDTKPRQDDEGFDSSPATDTFRPTPRRLDYDPRRETEVAGHEPTRPSPALKAEASADRAIDMANGYLLRADQERDSEVAAKYLRLAQLASETARNLLETAALANKDHG
ncbi:MAG: serine/threonine-protein kinase [Pyrinomonadaceae bacterium]